MPFPRNGRFVGREDELRSLKHFIDSDTHHRITIYGLGGCGKSALALEFAYRTLVQYTGRLIFWVPAISRQSFELAFREIGIRLRVPGIAKDNADIKQLIKKALSLDSAGDWLMIVDNADDLGVLDGAGVNPGSTRLQDYLPQSDRGRIIFTTRSRKAAEELTPSHVLELDDMSKAEAQQLLARRISKPLLLDGEKAVGELLKLLEYLPLAIVQAAAFINSNDVSVSRYTLLFQTAGTEVELFSEHFEDPSRYRELESTIARTWHISFDQIRRQDPLAAEYLSFMACIDRINIPRSLLPPGGSLLQQTKAIGTLKGYAFITEQQASQELDSERFFDMHRLVHMASAWWLENHGEQPVWTARAAARLEELIPDGGTYKRKETWTMHLSHAIYVTRLDGVLDDTAKASLLHQIGQCQARLGQYSIAEMVHRQALLLRERKLGDTHIHTLISANEVAVALERQGKYEEAELMHRQTLAQKEKVQGLEHPDTLASVYCLAHLLANQHCYAESRALYERACAAYTAVLGEDHPTTRSCHQSYREMLASHEQDQPTLPFCDTNYRRRKHT